MTDKAPLHIVFVLVPRFTLSALALATDVLRVSNREALRQVFSWDIVTADGNVCLASSGLEITPTRRIQDISYAPVALVLAAWEPEAGASPPLLAWLYAQDRQGAVLGMVETGAFVLAKAGLLKPGEAALHIESRNAFSEAYDASLMADGMWTLSDRRMSCSGVVSLLDLLLALIEREGGSALARSVADAFAYRPSAEGPPGSWRQRDKQLRRADRRLVRVVEIMQAHLEDPIPLSEITAMAGLSVWQARRLFKQETDDTPSAYYMSLRLQRARELLEHGRTQVQEIALACGFADAPSFNTAFRRFFGITPSECRKRVH